LSIGNAEKSPETQDKAGGILKKIFSVPPNGDSYEKKQKNYNKITKKCCKTKENVLR
jgi:hypothetical protein